MLGNVRKPHRYIYAIIGIYPNFTVRHTPTYLDQGMECYDEIDQNYEGMLVGQHKGWWNEEEHIALQMAIDKLDELKTGAIYNNHDDTKKESMASITITILRARLKKLWRKSNDNKASNKHTD